MVHQRNVSGDDPRAPLAAAAAAATRWLGIQTLLRSSEHKMHALCAATRTHRSPEPLPNVRAFLSNAEGLPQLLNHLFAMQQQETLSKTVQALQRLMQIQ